MEKIISTSNYTDALALFKLAAVEAAAYRATEARLAKVLGYEGSYCGCVSDQLHENVSLLGCEIQFLRALKDEDFIVIPGEPKQAPKKRRRKN